MNGSKLLSSRIILCIAVVFSGCSASGEDELQDWMKEQRNASRPRIEALPEPSKFSPQAYNQSGSIEPFSNQKLTQALKRDSNQNSSNAALIAPELSRRKESLEALPLDSVSMIGSLVRGGAQVALVKVDNLIYQVRVGNHLGQNYGRITKVTETGISLREIVQDASGEWIERTAALQLLEGSK